MSIDLHAHVLTEETMRLMRGVSAEHGPRLEGDTLVIGDVRYPSSPPGTWDLEARLAEMDRTRVDAQAVAGEMCAIQNEQLAALHRAQPTRFYPLGCVPLQDPPAAVAEAERAIRQL